MIALHKNKNIRVWDKCLDSLYICWKHLNLLFNCQHYFENLQNSFLQLFYIFEISDYRNRISITQLQGVPTSTDSRDVFEKGFLKMSTHRFSWKSNFKWAMDLCPPFSGTTFIYSSGRTRREKKTKIIFTFTWTFLPIVLVLEKMWYFLQ